MKDTNNQGKSFQERLAEAEERCKNATISDIIAAKRREADSIEASARGSFKVGEDLNGMPFTESDLEAALDLAETKRKEADRLEAALSRELSKNMSKNGADFGQLGDAAKLREALSKFCAYSAVVLNTGMFNRVHLEALLNMAKAALAAPPRNCDKYATLDEARNAYAAINELPEGNRDEDMRQWFCGFHDWLVAPATEKEGRAK